jgi:hypothetical protein
MRGGAYFAQGERSSRQLGIRNQRGYLGQYDIIVGLKYSVQEESDYHFATEAIDNNSGLNAVPGGIR